MHYFEYRDKELWAEGVRARDIIKKVDTPFYLYSRKTLLQHAEAFKTAFKGDDLLIAYAYKANSNIHLLRILAENDLGADVVSFWELKKALEAGVKPDKIVFNGNGKSREEMTEGIIRNIRMFNLDNEEELERINSVAREMKVKANISFRVNPEIDPETHPHIATALKESKFGVDFRRARELYIRASKMEWVEIKGIHMHIGSQITKVSPFVEALNKLKTFSNELKKAGIRFETVNAGGGLGIVYKEEIPPHLHEYSRAIHQLLKDIAPRAILEPGRVLVGNAGILVTRVLYRKKTDYKYFLVVDTGM
ncbi:MAG TPA: diaminopimelate decarboxylase, partial [bacterium]|nr:diaminopimelate decarboxylase [bacterium]